VPAVNTYSGEADEAHRNPPNGRRNEERKTDGHGICEDLLLRYNGRQTVASRIGLDMRVTSSVSADGRRR
jgi:hypothetical protein